ncbi:hypothetical protein KFE25_010833 [Diacronema lutheri]|uniref:Uncharacterized protein n=1 Tax=Diacronema lutheri TaxID=2081491 RepID=A0A8J6CAS7_DIALT|nr:hypothetical protein KFE25_010833 [Diacronema lutheri]
MFARACAEDASLAVDVAAIARAPPQSREAAHVLCARGEAHAERHEWEAALVAFSAALASAAEAAHAGRENFVDLAVVHELKAQALLALGDDWAAARAASDAAACDGAFAGGFHTLGRALRNMGELARALRALETAHVLFFADIATAAPAGLAEPDATAVVELAAELAECEALLVGSFVRLAAGSNEMPSDVDEATREWRAQLAARAHAAGAPMDTG